MTSNDTKFETIWQAAYTAGMQAGNAAAPTPMIVGTPRQPLFDDRIDPTKPVYFVEGGVCGFAWIDFKGNTAFGRWAKKTDRASKGYPTGLMYWVSEFGQSMQRKQAFASAFAKVLRDNGIDAYVGSRMD